MRICYLTDFFIPHYHGGGERRYYELAKRLVKKGHSVDIVCMRIAHTLDEEKINGIHIHHVGPVITQPPHRTLTDFFTFFNAQKKWLQHHDYDIIEAHGASLFMLLWVKYRLKKPAIALIHDVSSGHRDQWFEHSKLAHLYEKIVTRLPYTKILTVGNGTKNQLITHYHVPETKITVIHNGVDIKLIDSVPPPKKHPNTLIFVGRLIHHKHVDELLPAVQLVKKEIPAVHLTIIGTGPDESKLRHLTKTLHLKNTTFFGNLTDYRDVIRHIKQSSILVLPSTREGFGIALAEANACSIPVIAYDIEGVRDVVQSNLNGILTPPHNIQELARAITTILTNKTLRDYLGTEGRKRVQTKFTWDKTAAELEQFYTTLSTNTRSLSL